SRILLFFYCIVLPCLYLKYFSFLSVKRPPSSTIFPYTTLFRSTQRWMGTNDTSFPGGESSGTDDMVKLEELEFDGGNDKGNGHRSEEHTSELQSRENLVCRLLLEKKKIVIK